MPTESIPPHPNRTLRGSRALAWTCRALALGLPAAVVYGLWMTDVEALQHYLGLPSRPLGLGGNGIAAWQVLASKGLGLLPVLALSYGLQRAAACFENFAQGQVFSLDNLRHLRGLALGLLVCALATLLVPTLAALLMGWNAPPGARVLTLSVSSHALLLVLFAGLVWQITHAMAHALEIVQDHAQII